MDPEGAPAQGSEIQSKRRRARRSSSRTVRLGAIAALAVAAGLAAWALTGRSDDSSSPSSVAPSTPPNPAETVSRPIIQTVAQLRAAAATSTVPVYWAGARAGTRLELSQARNGTSFVRYLPKGVPAGDPHPQLTVATYARPNGFAEIQAAAKNRGAKTLELGGGGLAVYDPRVPTNMHLAYPGDPYQIEVFSPKGDLALRLVSGGAIRPVP